jgi:hypothetical protein
MTNSLITILLILFFFLFLVFPQSSYAWYYPGSLGEEDNTPWLLAGIAVTTVIVGGLIFKGECSDLSDSSKCDKSEINGRVGLILPVESKFTAGPLVSLEGYRRLHKRLKLGIGFLFYELNGPSSLYLHDVDEPIETDTYVLSLYLNLRVSKKQIYFGPGFGYFFATTDRKTRDSEFSSGGSKIFGDGPYFQVFFGVKSKIRNSKTQLIGEIKYAIMKPSRNPVGLYEEAFQGTDFGGVSISAGLAF